jgi:hypothetical protein
VIAETPALSGPQSGDGAHPSTASVAEGWAPAFPTVVLPPGPILGRGLGLCPGACSGLRAHGEGFDMSSVTYNLVANYEPLNQL